LLLAGILLVLFFSPEDEVARSSETLVNFTGMKAITPQTKVNFKKWSFKARVYKAGKYRGHFQQVP
jgi:hypothetical protein